MTERIGVGSMVVCIKDNWMYDGKTPPVPAPMIYPIVKTVYTVRDIFSDGRFVGLHLIEIVNSEMDFSGFIAEPSFDIRSFRPVKTTSIDVFTEMTVTPPTTTKELEPV